MEQKYHNYYECPTQVVFIDPANKGHYLTGIAYKDEIICGCCGGIFEIDGDIIANADEGVQPIYEYDSWVDISYYIRGGEVPDDFPVDKYEFFN